MCSSYLISWGSQQCNPHQVFLAPLHTSRFSGAVAGEKDHFCKGSLSLSIFLLCYCFFFLIFVCCVLSKIQKNKFTLYSCYYRLSYYCKMNIPEVEVRSIKQQGGESLKDAWYRICDAHHRSTKKYSTMILLRNFYVGISSWNRHILDTLIGGNFLGAPAMESYTLIESLVRVPPFILLH